MADAARAITVDPDELERVTAAVVREVPVRPILDIVQAKDQVAPMDDQSTNEARFVYFVAGGGLVKIGVANDPLGRLGELMVGSPIRLELLATVPGGRELEKALHSILESERSHGEWFHLTPRIQLLIDTARTRTHEDVMARIDEYDLRALKLGLEPELIHRLRDTSQAQRKRLLDYMVGALDEPVECVRADLIELIAPVLDEIFDAADRWVDHEEIGRDV